MVEEEVEHTATSEVNTGAQETKEVSEDNQAGASILFNVFSGN